MELTGSHSSAFRSAILNGVSQREWEWCDSTVVPSHSMQTCPIVTASGVRKVQLIPSDISLTCDTTGMAKHTPDY